jgi:hypothetical protein
MGRIYAVSLAGTVTSAGGNTDLWSFQAADDKPIRLRGFKIGQTSEVADAAEEGVRITVKRMPATWTVGSGGNAVTAVAPIISSADTAWSFTARTNDTTVGTTSGTAQILDENAWNIRNSPYEVWYPDSDFCPSAIQAQGLVICLETTLADDITFAGVAFIEELG